MFGAIQDAKYACRTLRKNPVLAAVAILSLAAGVGVNTAIFSVVNAVFLRPLPVEEPSRVVTMYTRDRNNPGFLACSWPNYEDFRDHNEVFSGLALYLSIPLSMVDGGGEPEPLAGQIVTANYFSVLGVRAAAGRTFLPEEDIRSGGRPVAVLSHGLWMRQFGADAGVLGRTISLNGHPFTIVGVAPPGFRGVNMLVDTDIWVPMSVQAQVLPDSGWFRQRRALLFIAIARLRPGVSLEQARAAMATLSARLEREHPRDNEGRGVTLVPLTESTLNPNQRGTIVRAGALLMGMSGLVLLIACANIANLLLSRAAARGKEIAVRLSVGAQRSRVVRQLLTESLLLAVAGGGTGLALARWAHSLLWRLRPPFLAAAQLDLRLDGRVLAFTFALAALTGIVFGLAPALWATRVDLTVELKERSGARLARRGPVAVQAGLVVAQVGLSAIALVGSGLFLRSLQVAARIDPGFDTARLSTLSFNLATHRYEEARGRGFQRQLLERVRGIPAVESATLASNQPFGASHARTVLPERDGPDSGAAGLLTLVNAVDTRYFETLHMPLIKGRAFTAADNGSAPAVAIVNETMARRYWPGQQVLGKRFYFFGEAAPVEIVGIVRDSVYLALGEEPRAAAYLPLEQNYSGGVTLLVRAAANPAAALAAARAEVRALDRTLRVTNAASMTQVIRDSLWAPRTAAALLAAFGLLALLLAAVGIYAVVSFSVNQRVREIGIRMALGAEPRNVLTQVLREGMLLVAAGLALGLAAALAGARAFASLLFGAAASDVLSFGAPAAVLLLIAVLACWIPARRATRVDPVVALRFE